MCAQCCWFYYCLWSVTQNLKIDLPELHITIIWPKARDRSSTLFDLSRLLSFSDMSSPAMNIFTCSVLPITTHMAGQFTQNHG